MKKVILISLCLLVALQVFAQKDTDEKKKIKSSPFARLDQADRIIVDVFTDIWMNAPEDNVMSISAINRGSNVYFMRDIPIAKSNFSFAVGAGISCHNIYSDAWPVKETVADTSNIPFGFVYTGKTIFSKLPSLVGTTETDHKNNKLTEVFVDIPIEFRFRTKNDGQKFKFALGFKVGYLLSSHLKYRGDDVSFNNAAQCWVLNSDQTVKTKMYKVPNIETYRMGPTFRIGWGYVNLSAYYSLTHLFKKDKNPNYDMYPISVGISITPF